MIIGWGCMKLVTSSAQNFFIDYRSPWKSMVKISVGIPTVDFIYFEMVGLSSVSTLIWSVSK